MNTGMLKAAARNVPILRNTSACVGLLALAGRLPPAVPFMSRRAEAIPA
jgi:hypothetical protein